MTSRRRWTLVGIAAAVSVCIGTAAAVALHRTVEVQWHELQGWADAGRQEYARRDCARPALWGDTLAGSAFDHYRQALAVAEGRRGDHARLIPLFHRPATVSAEEAAALRAAWAPAVAAMRLGAHCADARTPVDLERGFGQLTQNLLDARWVVNLAVIEARELVAAGQGRAAVALMLDAATMGRDCVGSPLLIDQMVGGALVAIATHEMWTDERLRLLDREALDLLAAGLRRLDAGLPECLPYEGELLLLAHQFRGWQREVPQLDGWQWPSAWRHGFSRRWMLADALTGMRALVAAMQERDGLRWPERSAWLDRRIADTAASGNPMLAIALPNLCSAEQSLRHTLTLVRLLRLGVDLHRGLQPVPLADPLGGGDLILDRGAAGTRLASAGQVGGKPVQRIAAGR